MGTMRDDIGLSIDMLDADRLREWADMLLLPGADIGRWGSAPVVAGKLQTLAGDIETAVRDIGVLRAALAPLSGPVDASGEPGTAAQRRVSELVIGLGDTRRIAEFLAAINALRDEDIARAAAVPSPPAQEPGPDDDVSDRYDLGYQHGYKDGRASALPPSSPVADSESLDAETARRLREYLWLGHGHIGQYGDDGEMQCGSCAPVWDYRRAPLADVIRQAVKARQEVNMAALIKQASAPSASAGASKDKE